MRIEIGGINKIKMLNDEGRDVAPDFAICSVNISLGPNEHPTATLELYTDELSVNIRPEDVKVKLRDLGIEDVEE